jgi:hypothetical protein
LNHLTARIDKFVLFSEQSFEIGFCLFINSAFSTENVVASAALDMAHDEAIMVIGKFA